MKKPSLPPLPEDVEKTAGWGFWIPATIVMMLGFGYCAYNPSYDENCQVVGVKASQTRTEEDLQCGTPDFEQDFQKGGNLDPRKKTK